MKKFYIYLLLAVGLFLPKSANALGAEAPIITLNLKSDVSCYGMSDGSASFILVGVGPFNYNLVGHETGSTTALIGAISFSGLAAGDYTLIVEDERLLLSSTFDTLSFTINQPAPLSLNPDITHINCNNPTGLVELNISGGSGSYSSLLDGLLVTLGLDEILDVTVGTHLIKITDSNGCEAEEEVTVQEIPDPVLDLGVDLDLGCLDLLDLNAIVTGGGGSNNYLWSTNDGNILNTIGNIATINEPGTYTATVTDANGCTSEDQVLVSADIDLPIINLASEINLGCLDSRSVTADVAAGIQVSWHTTNGQILGSSSGKTIEVGAPGIYIATALNPATGCESTKIVTVTADISLPSLNLGADVNLGCLSQLTLQANVGTGVEVSWVTSDGSILGSHNGDAITINAPGTYIAVATNALGCETTDEITVNADITLPSLNLGTDVNLGCLANINLNANVGSGVSVNWLTLDGHILGNSIGNIITVDEPGTYIAIATNALGCQDTDQIVVNADINLPVINLGADLNLGCLADIDLSANVGSGISVNWLTVDGNILGSSNGQTITVDQPGTYTAIATNSIGCQDTDQIVVNADIDIPVIDLGADLQISCDGELTLVADLLSLLNVDILWHALDGGHILGSNHGDQIDIDKPGTYVAVATNILTNCIASDTIQVTGEVSLLDIDLGVDLTLACGGSLTLGATLPVGINLLPSWSTPDGHILGSSTGLEVTIDLPGIYIATIVDPILGCSISDTIRIFGESPIDLNLGPDTVIGCNDTILLQTQSPGSLLNLEIQWTTEGGNILGDIIGHEIAIDEPGTYIAIALNLLSGCSGKDTIVVEGSGLNVDLGPDQNLDCQGMLTISAEVEGTDNPVYAWETSDGHIVGSDTGSSIIVDEEGTYTVMVTDQQLGCFSSDELIVSGGPTLTINGNSEVNLDCGDSYNASAQINGLTGLTIDWYFDGSLFAENTSQISITTPGIYVALGSDEQAGCMLTDTLQVGGSAVSVEIAVVSSTNCGESIDLEAQISGATGLQATWTTLSGQILATGTNQFTIDAPGAYVATVTDQEGGCTASDTITVGESGLIVDLGPDKIVGCGETYDVTVQISGGTNYSITWTSGGQVVATNTDHFLIETAGTYVVSVEDQTNGCSGNDTLVVTSSGLVIDLGPDGYPIACGGSTQIEAMVSDATNVVFNWTTSDGQIIGSTNTSVITAGSPGTYTVFAENTVTGCAASASVFVFQEGIGPEISVSEDQTLNCNAFNEITVNIANPIETAVTWSTQNGMIEEINGNSILVSKAGTYVVSVTALGGCTSSASVVIFENAECDTIEYPCCEDTTLTACTPYFYSFPSVDTSIVYEITQVSGLCSGSIFPIGETEIVFFISYETGDFDVISWTVTVEPFEIMAEITEPSCFGGSDGSISLILPEENAPYQLRWNTSEEQFGPTAEDLSTGTYTVTGLTEAGCIINQTFHLCQPDPLTLLSGLTISETDQLSDGAINITAAGGTAPYSFEWYLDGQLVSTEEDLYYVPAGSYTLKITDAGGCSRTWADLIISRISSDQAYSLYQQVRYPDKLVRYIKVYPNPSGEEVNLKLELKEDAAISVALADQMGHLMQDGPATFSDKQEYKFKLDHYSPGVYHMIIKVDDSIYVKKIFILN